MTRQSSTSTERRRVVVSGRVQGVGYRETCRRQALSTGAAGWVRNRSDGTVEAVFEGPGSVVGAMIDWCRQGPPWASVSGLVVEEEPPEGLSGFTVR